MHYNFDEIIDRRQSDSVKWATGKVFGDPEVLPLWVADMDFRAPQPVVDALHQRVEHGVYGYMIRPDSLYQAVIQWLNRRHGWSIEKEWLLVNPGVVPAINLALQAFTQPGDKVIVQPPVYYPFFSSIQNNGRQMIENQLVEENGYYHMDFDTLERQMCDPRARMLILCSPHNPVGRVWTHEELTRLAELCVKHQILLISDEIHHDLVFKPASHMSIASLSPEVARNTITLLAPSKTFNLAGFHTSLAVISDERLRQRFNAVQDSIGVGYTTSFGALAMETAYAQGEDWLEQVLVYMQGNLDFLASFLAERLPQVRLRQPEGTYLAWLDFRALGLSQSELNLRLLKQAKVGLNDGAIFGAGGQGFQRMNLGCPRVILQQALERMAASLV